MKKGRRLLMSHYVDLNSDLGESFGNYTVGMDGEVLNHVTSANVACGWHAGDPLIMDATVRMCKEKGVAVGAHPGYPDLMGFGRRAMAVNPAEAKAYMIYQVGALQAFCDSYGVTLQHMKLHGAFYNTACVTPVLADAVLDGLQAVNPNIAAMVLSGSYIAKEAQRRGTCSFYETATPDDIPLEYHKYFERKWRADKEAAENGEPPKKYKAV